MKTERLSNMKKKKSIKGFTLIELLAVLMIIGIIVLIALPIITNVLGESKEKALEDSAYGLIASAKLYYSNYLGEPKSEHYETVISNNYYQVFRSNDNFKGLKYEGDRPDGIVRLNSNGKVAIAVYNDKYCAIKSENESKVNVEDYNGSCNLP